MKFRIFLEVKYGNIPYVKEDFAVHKSKSKHHNKVFHEKITIQNRDLSTCITHPEGISYKLEMNSDKETLWIQIWDRVALETCWGVMRGIAWYRILARQSLRKWKGVLRLLSQA